MTDWDERFLRVAELVATWSKDPSTQVGCLLVRDRRIVATGFNGFPPRIADDGRLHDRKQKYPLVVHAEMNAILQAGHSARGSTAYTSALPPCSHCAKHLITAGIERVVFRAADIPERWRDDVKLSLATLREAGVKIRVYER